MTPPTVQPDVEIVTHRDPARSDIVVSGRMSDRAIEAIGPNVAVAVLSKIAEAIAAEYLRVHQQEILAAIDPQAVANLAVADAAAAVRQTLDDGLRGVHKEFARPREVLMPGLFGVKRGVVR